jgi:hypothetical protein
MASGQRSSFSICSLSGDPLTRKPAIEGVPRHKPEATDQQDWCSQLPTM